MENRYAVYFCLSQKQKEKFEAAAQQSGLYISDWFKKLAEQETALRRKTEYLAHFEF